MTPPHNSTRARLLNLLSFSFRSLAQAYGHTFVRRIVLQHPWRALRGLVTYGQTLGADSTQERAILSGDEDEFVMQAATDGERLLVAAGFCQKPVSGVGGVHDCPAGRFNHDCLFLSRLKLDLHGATPLPPTCAQCSIRVLGHAALQSGASFAVLTSAMDIAHDILLPALEQGRFAHFLFAICPYSVEPMSLALVICGLEGYILSYDRGACATYTQWLRADQGHKPERTSLSPQKVDRLLHLLDRIAAARTEKALPRATRYTQVGNILVPR